MYAPEHALATPDKPAVILGNSGETITYGEYEAASNRVAHLFRDLGLKRGDHVAFLSENTMPFFELQGGAERAGLYYTCINSHLRADEVAYIVDNCGAKVFVSSASKLEVAAEAATSCAGLEACFVFGAAPTGQFKSYEEAVLSLSDEPIGDEALGTAMLYSSGTTGQPKAILRPLPEVPPSEPLPVFMFIKNVILRLDEAATHLIPAPIFHAAPQASISAGIRTGVTNIVMESFDAETFLSLVEKYKVTHATAMVPTMFSRLLKLPDEVRNSYDVSSLQVAVHGAAPCPVPVKQAIIDWWGPIVQEYYGGTEAIGYTVATSEDWLARPGTAGKAVLGAVLILDDDGNQLPAGEIGTVYFSGATNFEYYNDPDKTASVIDKASGAATMGDVGYVDDDGWLFLTDRRSFTIISGGVNIYPQEAENVLVTHPAVFDAAVVGVADDDLGEVPKAYVQLASGFIPNRELETELIEFTKASLATLKCPRSVDFVDDLPRLPTGKLYKGQLRGGNWDPHVLPMT